MQPIACLTAVFLLLGKVYSRCECPPDLTMLLLDEENFRIVNSPDYPRYYCSGLNCTWHIIAPTNSSKIHFIAENIDLRDQKDWIEFYDHTYLEEQTNVSHACTGSKKPCRYSTPAKILTIRFISGPGSNDHLGFQGTVAGHDRELRALTESFSRYIVPAGVFAALLLVFIIAFCVCWFKNKRSPEYTLAPTVDKTAVAQ